MNLSKVKIFLVVALAAAALSIGSAIYIYQRVAELEVRNSQLHELISDLEMRLADAELPDVSAYYAGFYHGCSARARRESDEVLAGLCRDVVNVERGGHHLETIEWLNIFADEYGINGDMKFDAIDAALVGP